MMIVTLLLLCTLLFHVSEAFVSSSRRRSLVGSNSFAFKTDYKSRELDEPIIESISRLEIENAMTGGGNLLSSMIDSAESKHGMPWRTSIDKKAFVNEELLYMPFWEWHLSFMKENLSNLRVVSCSNDSTDFSYNENTAKKARIVNICLTSDEYRKIRMTYYDAGDTTQVYNAVCYPDPKYNLPVLGVDLLAFNRKKYLAIVDFQPLHDNEHDHAAAYEHLMKPIKDSYDNLSGRMSSKFYDETKFFSQQMLFARFEDEKIIDKELFPAFQEYAKLHLDLIRSVDGIPSSAHSVLQRQKAYDTYSAERDPATGLFAAMFGNEWAQDFVHDFLFSMSERKANVPVTVSSTTGEVNSPKVPVASAPTSQHSNIQSQPRREIGRLASALSF